MKFGSPHDEPKSRQNRIIMITTTTMTMTMTMMKNTSIRQPMRAWMMTQSLKPKAVAERRVRLGLLLTEVGRVNNVEVTEDDTRQAVFEEARRYPRSGTAGAGVFPDQQGSHAATGRPDL